MEISKLLLAALFLAALPFWIGVIFTRFLPEAAGVKRGLLQWLAGFLMMMASAQLVLVPLTLQRKSFDLFTRIYLVVLTALILTALVFWIMEWKKWRKRGPKWGRPALNVWQWLLAAGAFVLIIGQAAAAGALQHIDDDDSRFVVQQVIAVEQGNMYTSDLVTGELVYWNLGEMQKDMTSPWPMFLAFFAKIGGIHPASFSHVYLPVFLILLCYAVYTLIAMNLFHNDAEKVSIFLIFVSVLNLTGYSSTHTVPAMMLLRIWQGKAVVGALLVPVMFLVMYEIMENKKRYIWYLLGGVTAAAGANASGTGITILLLLIGLFGIVMLFHTRKIGAALLTWCMAAPSAAYLICYLSFWQLVKVYF